ncbi:MAG: IS1182 family transposase [Acidimicrobiales bacterium]
MTVGRTPVQGGLWWGSAGLVGDRLGSGSVFTLLHEHGSVLFPDELFEDLFSSRGRRSVPPQVVATVMVLQRLFGKSDREAVEAFEFDVRWKYAAGGLDVNYPGFVHTVLVDMRARLAASDRDRRIFEVVLEAATQAGLVGHRRVLDSTPLYDAVATMDTITLIRSAIRGLLAAADPGLKGELRAVLSEPYASTAKPQIDWEDPDARALLIDGHARDGFRCLEVLNERELTDAVSEAAELLATVLGQDIAAGDNDRFQIVWGVAKDRLISTVDRDTRHGHKTQARSYDGYKGHVAADPDSEIITDTVVTPANTGDGAVAEDLIADLRDGLSADPDSDEGNSTPDGTAGKVYGDCAYGTGEFQQHLNDHGLQSGCRTQPPAPRPDGKFTKDLFAIDLDADTVRCPAGEIADIERDAKGDGIARFGEACAGCPFRADCTTSKSGRTIRVGRFEAALSEARQQQANPDWRADYRATRPKIERKLAHLMYRRHGGRRARVRGQAKVDADFNLLAAAHNLARLATLQWQPQPRPAG